MSMGYLATQEFTKATLKHNEVLTYASGFATVIQRLRNWRK